MAILNKILSKITKPILNKILSGDSGSATEINNAVFSNGNNTVFSNGNNKVFNSKI